MKKLLSLALVLVLLFSVGAVGAAAQETPWNWDELEPVVLGQPLEIGTLDIGLFALTVEESGYFQFSWNSGDFDVAIASYPNGDILAVFEMWDNTHTNTLQLQAGRYIVLMLAFDWFSEHSVTITEYESPTRWERFVAAIGPLLLGVVIAAVIAVGLFLPLWWLGTNL